MPVLDEFAAIKLSEHSFKGLYRESEEIINLPNNKVIYRGKELLSFSNNDYLGLSFHPEVIESARATLDLMGVGGQSSRAVAGNNIIYCILENKIAKLKNCEAAIVYPTGYQTNIGILQALLSTEDVVFADRLIHASIIDGVKLSGADFFRFKHNDIDDCRRLLKKYREEYRNAIIISETVFSMDGDLGNFTELCELAKEFDCWIMEDDAHGLGIVEHTKALPIDIRIGTLSKSAGSMGGYVCGSRNFIDYLRNFSRSLIYTTALPPSILASITKSIDIISKGLNQRGLLLAQLFTKECNLSCETKSHIVPIILETNEAVNIVTNKLYDLGFHVVGIRSPTVPSGTARIRLSFNVNHKEEDVIILAQTIKQILSEISNEEEKNLSQKKIDLGFLF